MHPFELLGHLTYNPYRTELKIGGIAPWTNGFLQVGHNLLGVYNQLFIQLLQNALWHPVEDPHTIGSHTIWKQIAPT